MEKIESFSGEFRWLSNFVDCQIEFEGRTFRSVEHAYQSAKGSSIEWKQFCADWSNTSGQIKRKSREVDIVGNWNEIKKDVMKKLLVEKFNQHPFNDLLAQTGNVEIIEGNTWGDTFWGVDLRTGNGSNNLGKMIMEIRDSFKTKPLF